MTQLALRPSGPESGQTPERPIEGDVALDGVVRALRFPDPRLAEAATVDPLYLVG